MSHDTIATFLQKKNLAKIVLQPGYNLCYHLYWHDVGLWMKSEARWGEMRGTMWRTDELWGDMVYPWLSTEQNCSL